jgi:UDP-N-acetylmuramate-alanine ligase
MKIHFVGIGGIGVSALAQYYLLNGHSVSGEDVLVKEKL